MQESINFYLRRFRTFFFLLVGVVVVISSVAWLGLYLVCTYKGDLVKSFVEEQLSSSTNLVWQLNDNIEPRFFPHFGVSVKNLRAYPPDSSAKINTSPQLSVEQVQIEPDLLSLLVGKINIGKVTLDSLKVQIIQKEINKSQSTAAIPDKEESLKKNFPSIEKHAEPVENPSTENFKAEGTENVAFPLVLQNSPELTDQLENIKQTIQTDIKGRINHLIINNGELSLTNAKGGSVLTLSNINAALTTKSGKKSYFEAQARVPAADVKATVKGFFSFPVEKAQVIAEGEIAAKAILSPPNSRDISFDLTSSIAWRSSDNLIVMQDLKVMSEGDSLRTNLTIDMQHILVKGQLAIEKVSLPRWFMFARNFPPGLQVPLHTLKGTGNFELTERSVLAKDLFFTMDSIIIQGSVSTEDFSHPVVSVKLDIKNRDKSPLDIDNVFPFLAVSTKKVPKLTDPKFTMPYLVPYPGQGSQDIPDVGYNVTVKASKISMHSLVGGPLEVNVFPTKENIDCVLFSVPSFAEGAVAGRLDFDKKLVRMHYDLKNVNLSLMPENIGSSVTFAGKVTGSTDLSVKVNKGKWADTWGITFDAIANNLKVENPLQKWHLTARKTLASGEGTVDTIKKAGIKLNGVWKADTNGVFTSWNPKGDDEVKGTLTGVLAWPPEGKKDRSIYHVYGDLQASGVLIAPLARQLVPVRGTLTSPFDWRIDTGKVSLGSFAFDGWQSYMQGKLEIDTGKNPVVIDGSYSVKMSPRVLLKDWNLLPEAVKMPEVITGEGVLVSKGPLTIFKNLDLQVDGAEVTGEVQTTSSQSSKPENNGYSVLVESNFEADRIDLDKYIVPATAEELKAKPATTPWDFSFMQGINLKGKYHVKTARLRKANFADINLELSLLDNNLSFTSISSNTYGGRGTLNLQGTLTPSTSELNARKFLVVLKGVSLGNAIQDQSGEGSYGGIADTVLDLHGLMRSNADFPGALSGVWDIAIHDGVYPAFLGTETAGLRNTFSLASAHGAMEKGVLKTDNLKITGTVVGMTGSGWIDLGEKKLDLSVFVDIAGFPTAPVAIKGPFSAQEIDISGARVAVGAAQVAGTSIFYLLRGVLELPAKAIRGVGSLFEKKKQITGTVYSPKETIQKNANALPE